MGNISLNIDLKKIDQSICVKGDKGTYANLLLIPNKNGEDQYGNTHMVVQTVPKKLRKSDDQRGPIIGNGKQYASRNQSAEPDGGASEAEDPADFDDTIPF